MDLGIVIGLFADDFGECINKNITPNPIEGATIEWESHRGSQLVAYRTGRYNIIFKIKKDEKYYALRIPTGGGEISSEDLNAIANYIKYNPLPYFVDFSYIAQGIELEDGEYKDAILMEWVEGQTLDHYIEAHKSDPQELKRIASEFLKMIKCFHQRGIAHGDLQEGNIIIGADGSLKLVDYDSMYIPEFAGKNEVIKGKEGYQHNSRINDSSNKQTKKVDYFSELVIYLSLLAIAEKPSLWEGIGGNGLIFTQADFNMPFRENSTYKKLMALSAEVRELTEILVRYIETELYTNLIPFYEYIPRIKYDYISDYSEDLAIVRLNNKYGVIDRKGREIVPTIYEYITDYRKGWAIVTLPGGSKSWIDTKGTIIPLEEHPLYKQASPEKEKEKTQEKSDNNSREISSQKKESSSLIEKTQPQNLKRKNLWIAGILAIVIGIGFFLLVRNQKNINSEVLLPDNNEVAKNKAEIIKQDIYIKYDYVSKYSYSGLLAVKKNNKWGFINKEGKETTSLKYDEIGFLIEGMIGVMLDNKWGFIDEEGNEVISLKYDQVYRFKEGMAGVRLGYGWGFINKEGKEIVPLIYESVGSFSDNLAKVKRGGKWGFINKEGEEIVPFKYDYADDFTEGLARVKLNNKWGFIDKTGKEIISFKKGEYPEIFKEGLCLVNFNNEYGFIDKTGKEVFSKRYEDASFFSEGLAPVREKGSKKFGYIDTTGRYIITPQFSFAFSFEEGIALVHNNSGWFFIDKEGKCIRDCENDKRNK